MTPLNNSAHRFGGPWTKQKLAVLSKYLRAYQLALKDKPSVSNPFRKAYIDGFAGTGSRLDSESQNESGQESLFLGELDTELEAGFLDGSARMALRVEPHFDKYLFIERSQRRCNQLEELREDFPEVAKRIRVIPGDANTEIRSICSKNWSGSRAVLFLDPYGMQVEWSTIAAIAETEAIDLWLLFPLGVAVNRVLTKTGNIPEPWRLCLDRLFGDTSWYDELYRIEPAVDLFGDIDTRVVKASMDVIGKRFVERLGTVFPGVVEQPGVLRNSRGSPLYLFCFAAANPAGAPIAKRIAADLLKELV